MVNKQNDAILNNLTTHDQVKCNQNTSMSSTLKTLQWLPNSSKDLEHSGQPTPLLSRHSGCFCSSVISVCFLLRSGLLLTHAISAPGLPPQKPLLNGTSFSIKTSYHCVPPGCSGQKPVGNVCPLSSSCNSHPNHQQTLSYLQSPPWAKSPHLFSEFMPSSPPYYPNPNPAAQLDHITP